MTTNPFGQLERTADLADQLCAEIAAMGVGALQLWVAREYAAKLRGEEFRSAKVRRIEKLLKFQAQIFKEVRFINGELPSGDPDVVWKEK